MCVIFIDVNNAASNDTYQLIAANNRDEVYTRPTHPAAWWDDTCISGNYVDSSTYHYRSIHHIQTDQSAHLNQLISPWA